MGHFYLIKSQQNCGQSFRALKKRTQKDHELVSSPYDLSTLQYI